MKKLADIMNEIGTPNQYKSPEGLAKTKQAADAQTLRYNALKKQERELTEILKNVRRELSDIQREIHAIESEMAQSSTDINDFKF